MKYFSYKLQYKDSEHFTTTNIVTVKYHEESKMVENNQGVKISVRFFLKKPHIFHDTETPPVF